jgi:hypothetical protein
MKRRCVSLVALAFACVAATGCAGSAVTGARLEQSVADAFTRRYDWHEQLLGRPAPGHIDAQARCVRGTSADRGAGSDWTCTVQYFESGPSTPVTFGYDVHVHPDLCWTADSGPRSLGGATLRTKSGQSVPNPVYAIDACFQAD